MKTRFLHRRYAEDNGDVHEAYGTENEAALARHFNKYGAAEGRGVPLGRYAAIEGVLASEQGHVFLSGWADRRLVRRFDITVEVGYVQYELGEVELCWYHRGDVANVIGDTGGSAGFVALLKIPDLNLNSNIRILINDQQMYENDTMRWQSVDHFLQQSLGAVAMLADRPAGEALTAANALMAGFQNIWGEFLQGVSYTKAFETRPGEEVDQSVIIALYRKADMLLPQLECLADTLRDTRTEVIVVCNQLQQPEPVIRQLAGFCQLNDIRLAVYLCPLNSGFSAANNFGADVARGDTLIFMNPDIFPPEQNEGPALEFLTSPAGEGLTGALLYYGDGMLMHSGMYVASDIAFDARGGVSEPILRVEHYGKGLSHHIEDDDSALDQVMAPVRDGKFLVTAALWKIRKSLFDEMGGLSTDYLFAYYEDADFCLRMLQAGHPVEIDESARWIHMEGVGKPKPPAVRSFMWLNRALFSQRFASSGLVAPASTDLFQL